MEPKVAHYRTNLEKSKMSTEHRRDPDSEENQAMHMDALRAVFAARMQYRVEQGPCGPSIELDRDIEGLVECPGCGNDVRWQMIRDGRCPDCPEPEDE